MKENFDKAVAFTLEHEGGLVNNPNDPGGLTNLGISFRFLKGVNPDLGDVNNDGVVNEHDIQEMTVEQASKIYKIAFWDTCKCDELPPLVDAVVFDTGVNMGTGTSIKLLQRTLNGLYNTNLKEDGGIGPKTKAALNEVVDNLECANAFLDSRRNYYVSLAENKPRFKIFLKGWMNRVNDLEEFIKE
jgi:lysozyme family protein